MRLVLTTDQDEFARHAGKLLQERLEYNLMASVLAGVIEGVYEQARFAYELDPSSGEARFAAMRTPPWGMLATALAPGDAAGFVGRWLEQDPEAPGVTSATATARAIAAGWRERTGGSSSCRMRQAMHVLEEVRDPRRPADGELRLPDPEERALLVAWWEAFTGEARLINRGPAEAFVDMRLAREWLLVWDHDGPVSLVGVGSSIAGVARIGPVYTPPEHRRRGYAGTAVAAVSRRELARGARACTLFTDLANPTSNKIYAEVGYRRVADWEEHVFERP